MKQLNISYKNATGTIKYTLKSDLMFHYVMQKSKSALKGLICALKGISPSDVKEVIVMNPIDLNSAAKETVLDLKLVLNNNEILNIELQVYTDKYWINRSILYLCRAYDSIGEGGDYSKLKPTTHFCITDQELILGNDEFYSSYLLLNTKNYQPYSDIFGIKVLQLNHTDSATKEDVDNDLVYWANLFKADTWEEFKKLADNNPAIEEVGNLILELNTDNKAKEILEGQRRYREMLASQYAAGYSDAEEKLSPTISNLRNENDDLKERNENLKERNENLKESNDILIDENSQLKAEIAKLQSLLSTKGD